MSNSKFFPLPDGSVAVATVDVDPATGQPVMGTANVRHVRFYGKRAAVQNTSADVWEGPTAVYVPPAAPIQMQVVSSSASDAAAGTGAQTVDVIYLDAIGAEHTETVTLNGTTPVLTAATNIRRANEMHVKTTGSGGVAAGNISLQAVGGAVTYRYIVAGFHTDRTGFYTVPSGYKFGLAQWQTSSGSSGSHFCQTQVLATSDTEVLAATFLLKDEMGTQNGGVVINYPNVFEEFPAGTDIKLSVISDASNANVTALNAVTGRLRPVA